MENFGLSWTALTEVRTSQIEFIQAVTTFLDVLFYGFQIVGQFEKCFQSEPAGNAISDQIFIFIRAQALEILLCLILTEEIQLSGILEQHDFLGYSVIQTTHLCPPPVYIPFTMSRSNLVK